MTNDERAETPAHCVSICPFPFGIRHSAFGIPGIDCLSDSCAIAHTCMFIVCL
jgi:hypothetical protein